jgi:alkylated DNA repair protein alkB family protein 1
MAFNCDEETDNFKPIFKYFKNTQLSSDSKEVIDFSHIDEYSDKIRKIPFNLIKSIQSPIKDDFRDVNDWEIYTLNSIPGLYVIPQILTKESSKKWFNYFLNEIAFINTNSLKANISLPPSKTLENNNLRWISFGYHHNWDTKVYEEEAQSPIPLLIEQFADYVSSSLGFSDFRAEAGLINYYRYNSTLCPHSDHSEPNKNAPLFSLSLGSTAIFLIGGTTKSSKPIIPIYLKDSDLLVMSSECRQAFHAIPKVLAERNQNDPKLIKRINLNIRQVY